MKITKRYLPLALIVPSLLFSTGCAQTRGNNATTGALLGGITGALITSGHTNNPAATMLGTLAGAMIGSEIGAYMDELDQQCADRAFNQQVDRVRPGKVIVWHNPDNGHHGRIIVLRDRRTPRGVYYREFQHHVIIDGRTQKVYGKAYRRPDGGWQIVH